MFSSKCRLLGLTDLKYQETWFFIYLGKYYFAIDAVLAVRTNSSAPSD